MVDTTTATHELHGPCGDEDERVTVQSLVDDEELSIWWLHGPGRNTVRLSADDAPDAGGYIWCPRETYSEREDDVTLVQIPHTVWGDYVGDSYNRANHRAILDNYADDVIRVEWPHSTEGLALRLDGTIPSGLADEIRGLSEYPLICDDTHSTLELELELEDWDSYARDDLRLDVERKLEKLRDGDDVELSWLLTDELCTAPSDGALLRLVERARYDGVVTWDVETAVGGYFRGLEELADTIVAARVRRARRDLARILAEYSEIPGQLQLG